MLPTEESALLSNKPKDAAPHNTEALSTASVLKKSYLGKSEYLGKFNKCAVVAGQWAGHQDHHF